MTSIINPDSFIADEIQTGEYFIEGTVEVTLHNETRRVRALTSSKGTITAFGMTGRYQTGMKAWPARVDHVIDPTNGQAWNRISFGRDERAGRCKKTSHLFFTA